MKIRRHRVTTGSFAASRLTVDPEVQRALGVSPAHVKRIRQNWEPKATGRITVSKRPDGRLVVIDGMHRVEAAPPDFVFRCDVHEGLTFEEECDLFRKLNTTRVRSAFDDFDKGVKAGDPECIEIAGVVAGRGLKIGPVPSDGRVAAVASLRNVYKSVGADGLDRTLGIVTEAWGPRADALDGKIIQGIGQLVASQNGALDDAALVKKLSKYAGGPTGLLGAAKGLKAMRPGTLPGHVASITLDLYNHGRRKKLES